MFLERLPLAWVVRHQLYTCQSSFVWSFVVVSVNPYPYVYPTHTTRVQIEAFDGDPAVLCLDVENMQAPDLWCHVLLHWCRSYWRECVGHLWESQEHHNKWTNINCVSTNKWSYTFMLCHFSYFETMCWMTIMYWSGCYLPLSHGPTNLVLTMWEWGPHCYIYMGTAVP